MPQKLKDNRTLRLVILILTLLILILVWLQRGSLLYLARYGYAGIFLINLLASATVMFPVPGVASVVLGGALWNPFFVGLVSGTGAALGELTGYFMGYGGRGLVNSYEDKSHWLVKIEHLFKKRGMIAIFLFAAIPFPFDFVGLLAGSLNYPVWKYTLSTILGRVLRNTIIALTGAKILPI